MKKISWGVLSTAKIGRQKVIPAMQKGKNSQVAAIASRDLGKAQKVARELGIPKAYGTYDELLADRDIEAIYIPLPNRLHVEWTIKSLQAGKHVLCEKPIAVNGREAEHLLHEAGKFPGLKVKEAFMYRHHPQWLKAREVVHGGAIGELKTLHSIFTYYNVDPNDVRNQFEIGGGGLLDIGCYCISVARFIFNGEPKRVCGTVDYDPHMKIDRLASGVLDFGNGTATFSCSTQTAHHQRVEVYGTLGNLEITVPFTPRPDETCRLIHRTASKTKEILVEAHDQYTIQGDLFSQAIINDTPAPTPLADAVANMKVIDAVFASHKTGRRISF